MIKCVQFAENQKELTERRRAGMHITLTQVRNFMHCEAVLYAALILCAFFNLLQSTLLSVSVLLPILLLSLLGLGLISLPLIGILLTKRRIRRLKLPCA